MVETIAKLVQFAPAFSAHENGSAINEYFERSKESEGVVILNDETPVGILMRHDFYQQIGRQFGYSLYMNRDVTLLMKKEPTCVDTSCDMARFGFIAMNRSQKCIYDFIVVLENGKYIGIVSIREFLIEMSKTKEREIELLSRQQLILEQKSEAEKLHRIEIEQKNASIKNLLDNAGQGFLFFGCDLTISEEYSKECDDIFGFSISGKDILEVLQSFADADDITLMRDAFARVLHDLDKVRIKAYMSILPKEIRIGERYIQIDYKVIPSQAEKSIMLILTDITDKKELELKNAEERNNIKLVIRALSSKSEINAAIDDLREFVGQGALQLLSASPDTKTALQHIFRVVHTMKGDFSLNSLFHTAAGLHQLEDTLGLMLENTETTSADDIREFIRQISSDQLLQQDISVIKEALGASYYEKDDVYTISGQRLAEIESKAKELFRGKDLALILSLLGNLVDANLKDILESYNDYIKVLAERLGKKIGDIRVAGNDIYISKNRYAAFTKSLVHIFRNFADHGIEDPDTRIEAGKPEQGEISCFLEKSEGHIVLCLADDGKGIDLDAIKRKAVEKGIYSEEQLVALSQEQILETIFEDDFSTKSTVDLYSGRGVGLAAVRAEVLKLGGSVTVETKTGQFTRFRFVVPTNR